MTCSRLSVRCLALAGHLLTLQIGSCALAVSVQAQPRDEGPAFSLASGGLGSSRDRPTVDLMFRNVDRLDFRVYRVNDPFAFMARLKDPHQLGSEEPLVDQEPTWLERIAAWKARRRAEVRSFVRSQISREYRVVRRRQAEAQVVALRQPIHVNTFAQVPVLNRSQLVTAWREILPRLRDTDVRRIPLDVREPGMYVVEAVRAPLKAYTIVLVSDVAVVSKAAPGQLVLFAADRFTGAPRSGCRIQVLADRQVAATGETAADGTFEADLRAISAEDVVSVGRCGSDVVATDPGSWYFREASRDLVAYVYTDKPIYRPAHTVRVKAILRWRTRGSLTPMDAQAVEVRISDPTDKVVYRESRPVDPFGAVQATWPVPAGAALGAYSIAILSGDAAVNGAFEVQEYRKPEFEVRVNPAERFVLQGSEARLSVDARYYFGQPVARGRLKYVVHRQPYFSPLRWSDDEEGIGAWWYGGEQTTAGDVWLSERGTADIRVPAPPGDNARDYSLRIEARVTDGSGREVSGVGIVHATWGRFLVSTTTSDYVVAPGGSTMVTVRAVDYEGHPQAGRQVTLHVQRRTSGWSWDEDRTVANVSETTVQTDETGRATHRLTFPAEAGDYRIRGTALDGSRAVVDDAFVWVPGPRSETAAQVGDRYLELIADRGSYEPGDVARVLVRGEDFDAPVLVTKESQHVSWRAVVRARGNAAIEVPVGDEDVGDTWINVAFLRDNRLFRAERRIRVPAVSRALTVTVQASDAVSRPGQKGRFVLTATDADGRPVQAQLSVGVIDEAVYGVKPESTPDPLRFFYRREYSRVGTQFSREYSFVGYSGTEELLLARRRRPHGLADFKADRPAQPQVRKEFPDAIYWVGDLVTDATGRAEIEVPYPDALTTWRLTARAVTADTLVGAAVARTTTTRDLILRVVTPRFLTEGDHLIVPVITHNYRPAEEAVALTLDATGLRSAEGAAAGPREIVVPSGGEQRLDWRFTADRPGTATLTGTARAARDGDAVAQSFPVLPFGLATEASRAGSASGTGEQTIALDVPAESNAEARSVAVSLAPSPAGAVLGALDFLTSFPYGCTEQVVSSYLPNLIVSRTLAELRLTPTEALKGLDRQVTAGTRRLLDLQHESGGWGWWAADRDHPFMTAYALHALLETQKAGYKVDDWRIRRAAQALSALYAAYPRAVPALKAYVTHVLVRAGDTVNLPSLQPGFQPAAAVDELWNRRGDLTPYGAALLLLTLDERKDGRADVLARDLESQARQEGDLAWWPVDQDPLLDDWADTSVEATALAIQALARRAPRSPLLEKALRYVLVNRTNGLYWGSTKQTAMVIYALLDYLKARGEAGAPVTTDVRVNDETVKTVRFTAASLTSPDPVIVSAPAKAGRNTITLTRRGDGAVYWSVTTRWFDTRTPIARTGSRALGIVRRYFSLSPVTVNGRTVYRETPFAGTARPGDVLLVRVSVAGSSDWRYLLIEDPLPAGAEPIAQDEFYELEKPAPNAWWWGRRELRDDRVAFFRERLEGGRVDLHYLLKVVTPGTFTAMPARVTPMYVPGVSASSDVQAVDVPVEGVR